MAARFVRDLCCQETSISQARCECLTAVRAHLRIQVAEPVAGWLQEGAEPGTLARSAGIGFSLGLCPLMGAWQLLLQPNQPHPLWLLGKSCVEKRT